MEVPQPPNFKIAPLSKYPQHHYYNAIQGDIFWPLSDPYAREPTQPPDADSSSTSPRAERAFLSLPLDIISTIVAQDSPPAPRHVILSSLHPESLQTVRLSHHIPFYAPAQTAQDYYPLFNPFLPLRYLPIIFRPIYDLLYIAHRSAISFVPSEAHIWHSARINEIRLPSSLTSLAITLNLPNFNEELPILKSLRDFKNLELLLIVVKRFLPRPIMREEDEYAYTLEVFEDDKWMLEMTGNRYDAEKLRNGVWEMVGRVDWNHGEKVVPKVVFMAEVWRPCGRLKEVLNRKSTYEIDMEKKKKGEKTTEGKMADEKEMDGKIAEEKMADEQDTEEKKETRQSWWKFF